MRLGQAVGVDEVAARVATLAGIEQPPAFPSLLLGAIDLTPLRVLRIYGVFASGGFATPIKTVLAVRGRSRRHAESLSARNATGGASRTRLRSSTTH